MTSQVPLVHADEIEALRNSTDPRPLLIVFQEDPCCSAGCGEEPCCPADSPDMGARLQNFAAEEKNRLRVVCVPADDCENTTEALGQDVTPAAVLCHHREVVAVLGHDDVDYEDDDEALLARVSGLVDLLEDCPLEMSASAPELSTYMTPASPSRQLHFNGPVPGGLTISAQPGKTAETVISVGTGHTVSLDIDTPDIALDALSGLSPDALDALSIDIDDERDLSRLVHLTGLKTLDLYGCESPSRDGLNMLRSALPFTIINNEWIHPTLRSALPTQDQPVRAQLEVRRHSPQHVTAYLSVLIAPGYQIRLPSDDDSLSISVMDPSSWEPVGAPIFPAAGGNAMTGTPLIVWLLEGESQRLELVVRCQVRDEAGRAYLPPTTLHVGCDVTRS
ncbi:hypothetical protein OG478_12615 [Streptomyces phaeochromogenes]|uniref:hypothetical protein n=1 Tax=Streptomyces phaeochromogenes TaxID=1923 RepID=UPI003867390A|nr:hypothetical protein OG478_12615 [Streptomyces phaeochromogenes]